MAETRASRPERIGRYRIVDRIGRGAMGVVYAAHDDVMDRDVAVKVMMTDLESEPDIRARFMREAQVSAQLSHRNIVTIFDVGEDNGRLFIVMELLRGQTLADCLKQRTLALEEKVDLTLEVCEGLAVASAEGICHRDVKPGNLFLTADGGVKILDFGIARLASSSMTASGFIVGTPDYMSPEQARGNTVDERSDIFSVGAVLYFMLAGRKPFAAPDLPAVLHKVLSEDPPQLGPAEAPVGLARLVVKSLAKDPKERFQSFREFSAELTQWRRRYEVETRTLAKGVAKTVEQLLALAEAEQTAAEPLNVSAESTVSAVLAQLGDGYPDLVAHGAEALRNGQWYRVDVDEIARRVAAVRKDLEPRVATLRTAAQELAAATSQLEAGDARAALVGLDRVLRRVPAANLDSLVARTRKDAAEQQARDDKVRSLLVEAASAHGQGRLQTAQTLAEHALSVDAHNRQARDFLLQVQLDIAVAEADKARRCERCIERARSALKDGHLEEAERQVQLAVDTGSPHPDIATLGAAVAEAKLARDHADAWIEEIAREIALARSEFQTVDRKAAIARLEALVSKHASSAAAKGELARLQSEAQRLETVERKNAEAERLAESAAQSLANGDPQTAAELADRALELVESQQLALKTSAMAHARLRENAKRHAREERARQLVDSAKAFLSRGRYDRALRDAREAADLDPAGTDASEIIAEAVRRQTDAARALALEQDAANRAAEVRKTLAAAGAALRAKEFARARHLAEQVLAFDPNNGGCRELIAKIATAEAVAARTLEDETVDLQEGNWDPDATVVVEAATGGWMPTSVRSWWNRVRTAGSALSASIRVSSRQERRASVEVETVSADVAQRPETTHKEA